MGLSGGKGSYLYLIKHRIVIESPEIRQANRINFCIGVSTRKY